jgi:hypothetical protein
VQPSPIAVIRGHYDAVEVILAELGIPFERLSPGCLSSPELASYKLVLVNCRSPRLLHPTTVANVRAFVAGGGSMYFSDLTMPNIEQAWPELLEPARATGVSETRPARVVDAELRSFLGEREQVDLRFNLGGWRRPDKVARNARVLLADAERRHPYMVLLPAARGLVGFTSFHYSAQPLDDMVTSLVYFVTRL